MKIPHILGEIAAAGVIGLSSMPNELPSAPVHTVQTQKLDTLDTHQQYEKTAYAVIKQGETVLADLLASGFIAPAEAAEIVDAARNLDQGKMHELVENASSKHSSNEHEPYNNLTLLISAISLLWFGNMIIGCIKGQPVSFIKHHVPFVAGLLAMHTQIPHEIQHSLVESVIAFAMIMGISRTARGVTNKVDLHDLDEEQAKTVLLVWGPIASLITTPAMSTIFAPLRTKLEEKDKYIAMHAVSNVDGAAGIGDFPFLYVWLKKGALEGTIWQAKLMLPIMAFHKIVQAVYFKVGPNTVWKHRELLWKVVTGFRFEGKRLGESHDIVSEETALLQEFLEYIQGRIGELEAEIGIEGVQTIEALLEDEEKAMADLPEDSENDSSTQLEEYKILEKELTAVLADPTFLKDHVGEAVSILRQALADEVLTKAELQQFHNAHHAEALVQKVPGLRGWIRKQEIVADQLYSKISDKLNFSHNEVEIGKVFTAQALAIGLLVPVISTILGHVPQATELVTTMTSSTADNYAATAITWATNNAKSLSFAILAGSLTIYGNMADLNFLGKDANFKKSVQYAKYMLPTLGFAALATNPGVIQHAIHNPKELLLGASMLSLGGLSIYIRKKVKRTINPQEM